MTIQELLKDANLTRSQTTTIRNNLKSLQANQLRGLADDVARAEQGSIVTRAGLALLAKGIAGKLIKFSRVAIGDSTRNGDLVDVTDEQALDLTTLINPRLNIPIIGCQASAGVATVQAFLRNADIQEGFWVREMGLFALDPDSGNEILYSYRNTGLLSFYTPAGNSAVVLNRQINLLTVIDNAQNISAVIDASAVYVSQAVLTEHVLSDNPHPNIIFPSYDAPLDELGQRLSQVENNVANLFMQLGSEANLIIYEDFKDLESCCKKERRDCSPCSARLISGS